MDSECSLCHYLITKKENIVKYGECGHIIHLRCFAERGVALQLGVTCLTCVQISGVVPAPGSAGPLDTGSSSESDIDVKKNRRKKTAMSVGTGGELKRPRFYPPLVDDNIGGYAKLVRELRRGNPESNFSSSDGSWFLVEEIIRKKAAESLQTAFFKTCNLGQPGVGTSYSGVRQGECYQKMGRKAKKASNHIRLKDFIDQVNTESSSVKFLHLPKVVADQNSPTGNGSVKGGSISQVVLPHEVGGEVTWLPVENTKFRELGTDITNKKRVEIGVLRANGFTAVHMLQIGVTIKHLVYACRYELKELIDLGFTWHGILGLRMTLNDFDDQQLSLENFLSFFPSLCVEDLLIMPPHDLLCDARVSIVCHKLNSPETAVRLGFRFEELSSFMSPVDVYHLSQKITLQELVEKLGMNLEHMKQIGIVSASFFKNAGWTNHVAYLAEKINFNAYDIAETESYDTVYNDESGVAVGVDDIRGNEMGDFVYKTGNVETEEIDRRQDVNPERGLHWNLRNHKGGEMDFGRNGNVSELSPSVHDYGYSSDFGAVNASNPNHLGDGHPGKRGEKKERGEGTLPGVPGRRVVSSIGFRDQGTTPGVDPTFGGLFKTAPRNLVSGTNVKGGEKYYGF